MMISYETGPNKFHCRAASIILHNNKVLLQRLVNEHAWFIPGGRVEFNEAAEQTIEREMLEEFDVSILDRRMVWIVENFVEFADRRIHEIGLFFLVTLPENHPIYKHDSEFAGVEDGFIHRWVSMDKLDDYLIVPEFVVPELKLLNIHEGIQAGVKHIVNRSVR
ncbi:NUDIX hydrolase [Paenibacillus eucommiae]|uniref:8-oxo-dGTP pyrophosphatase MutT (NUDIX family) n=1 Tax=Paenibacillus eucommiae TaxID=1355755 RepID=A0ABS4J5H1_9BACL|nr:NUDIX domain-containing protein [Paenibacillus eucommiae]MBP1995055.1 8-oxo-dGTP pyrophosphatase MutT (NUDIX family) [Paenibacillus eucommiae]